MVIWLVASLVLAQEGRVELGAENLARLIASDVSTSAQPEEAIAHVLSRDIRLAWRDGALELSATWVLASQAPAWFDDELVGHVDVSRATVDGRPAALEPRPRAPSAGPAGARALALFVDGARVVRIEGTVRGAPDLGAVRLDLLPAATSRIVIDGGDLVAQLSRGDTPLPHAGGVWWTSARRIDVALLPARAADTRQRATTRTSVGVTVRDGEVDTHARVTWAVHAGRLQQLRLRTSNLGSGLDVTGSAPLTWRREGDQVVVDLLDPTTTTLTLDLRASHALGARDSSEVPIPVVEPLGVLANERVLQIGRESDLEVVPELEGGNPLARADVPAWAVGVVNGSPLVARSGPARGHLSLLRFVPVDRPPLVVDVAEWHVALSEEGRTLMQGTLTLRNERAGHLGFTLPPGHRPLAIRVDGRPVRPSRAGDGWSIALPRSVDTVQGPLAFAVTLAVLGDSGQAWEGRGAREVSLPSLDAPVAVRRVRLVLPPGVRHKGEVGDAGVVEDFTEGQGLSYGFGVGVDEARASAIYQDALQSWMDNDFDDANTQLDSLRALGADNENMLRLQSNLDLVLEDDEAAKDTVIGRRVREQAKARAAGAYRQQADLLREAETYEASGELDKAEEVLRGALELAERLERVEQEESVEQETVIVEARHRMAAIQVRRGSRGSGGLGLAKKKQAAAPAPPPEESRDIPEPAYAYFSATPEPAAPLARGDGQVTQGDQASPVNAVEAPAGLDSDEFLAKLPAGRTDQGAVALSGQIRGGADHNIAPATGAEDDWETAREGVGHRRLPDGSVEYQVDGVTAHGMNFAAAGAAGGKPDAPRPNLVVVPTGEPTVAPTVVPTEASVVIPVLGEMVRFQHVLIASGDHAPIHVVAHVPRRTR